MKLIAMALLFTAALARPIWAQDAEKEQLRKDVAELVKQRDEKVAEIETLLQQNYDLELRLRNGMAARNLAREETKLAREKLPPQVRQLEEALSLARTLRTFRVSLDMQNATLGAFLRMLTEYTDVTFKLDDALAKDAGANEIICIKIKDLLLESTLKLSLQPKGYDFVATPKGEVLITTIANAREYRKSADTVGTDTDLLIRYVLSTRPESLERDAEARRQVESLLAEFEKEDMDARDKASAALLAMGRDAWLVLKSLDRSEAAAEARARLKQAHDQLEAVSRLVESMELDRDIAFLSRLSAEGAYERLRHILAGVRPFSVDGFPKAGPGLAEYLQSWWSYSKDRVRWNAAKDVYEPK